MRSLPALIIAGVVGLTGFATLAHADPLSGTWSGGGYVQPKDGAREKVSCRVTYSPQGGTTVGVSATCATSSMTIHQTGSLTMVNPNKYVGDFYNSEFDVSGRIRVSVSGGSQTVSFGGARGAGSLSLSRR